MRYIRVCSLFTLVLPLSSMQCICIIFKCNFNNCAFLSGREIDGPPSLGPVCHPWEVPVCPAGPLRATPRNTSLGKRNGHCCFPARTRSGTHKPLDPETPPCSPGTRPSCPAPVCAGRSCQSSCPWLGEWGQCLACLGHVTSETAHAGSALRAPARNEQRAETRPSAVRLQTPACDSGDRAPRALMGGWGRRLALITCCCAIQVVRSGVGTDWFCFVHVDVHSFPSTIC